MSMRNNSVASEGSVLDDSENLAKHGTEHIELHAYVHKDQQLQNDNGPPSQTNANFNPNLLFYTSLFSSLGVVIFGFEQGVMSLIVSNKFFLNNFNNPTPILIGTIVAILEFSAMISCLFVPYVSNRYGRRKCIILGAFFFVIGATFQSLSPIGNFGLFIIILGRLIAGFGIGILSSVVPLFQSEISPVHKRGLFGCIEFSGNILGYSLSVWIDYFCGFLNNNWSWRLPLAFQSILGIILMLGGLKLVESPRWLISKKLDSRAQLTLEKLFGPLATEQLILIKSGIENEEKRELLRYKDSLLSKQPNSKFDQLTDDWILLLGNDELPMDSPPPRKWINVVKQEWKLILIGFSSLFFAQFGGINLVSYYSMLIFKKIGFSDNIAGLICGFNSIFYFLSTMLPWIIVDANWKTPLGNLGGRRFLFISGGFIMGMALIAASISQSHSQNSNSPTGTTLVAVFIVIYQCAFGYSWGPIAWLYNTEIYADSYTRAIGSSIGTSVNWSSNFIVGEISPILLQLIGWRLYLIYGIICLLGVLVCWWFYPETRGVELEDMEELFEKWQESRSAQLQNLPLSNFIFKYKRLPSVASEVV